MPKALAITTAALALFGAVLLNWVRTEQSELNRLIEQQRQQVQSSLDKLDRIVAGETDVTASYDIASGEQLQRRIEKYNNRAELRELALTVSILSMVASGLLLSGWSLSRLCRWAILRRTRIRHALTDLADKEHPSGSILGQDEQGTESERKRRWKVMAKSGWKSFAPESLVANESIECESLRESDPQDSSEDSLTKQDNPAENETPAPLPAAEQPATCTRTSNNESKNPGVASNQRGTIAESPDTTGQPAHVTVETEQPSAEEPQSGDDAVEPSNNTTNSNHTAQTPQQRRTGVEQIWPEPQKPLTQTLTELSEQVAAIREYAAQQQNRVERLQDGYDWNIVRTFCLRIIRCIDNIENRIARLSQQNIETADLEEVRDELIFALESGGVEQFTPELYSDYRGQEKHAETVRNREYSDNPEMKGKVAKVLKQGYRYVVGEDNYKIVRPAQVKLFA